MVWLRTPVAAACTSDLLTLHQSNWGSGQAGPESPQMTCLTWLIHHIREHSDLNTPKCDCSQGRHKHSAACVTSAVIRVSSSRSSHRVQPGVSLSEGSDVLSGLYVIQSKFFQSNYALLSTLSVMMSTAGSWWHNSLGPLASANQLFICETWSQCRQQNVCRQLWGDPE